MEARSTYSGSRSSKSLVAVMAVVATMGLGLTAGVVAKNLNGSAAPQTHKIAAGLGGAAQENPARQGGVQIVGGNSAPAAAVGPDDRPTTTKLTPAYQQVDTRGVKPAAISTLQVDTRGIIPAEAFGPGTVAAPYSSIGPDAQERNATAAAASAKLVLANARGHRWI